jgi:hypothetical protein
LACFSLATIQNYTNLISQPEPQFEALYSPFKKFYKNEIEICIISLIEIYPETVIKKGARAAFKVIGKGKCIDMLSIGGSF